MVCEKTLAEVANRIGLGNHLLLGHGEDRLGDVGVEHEEEGVVVEGVGEIVVEFEELG